MGYMYLACPTITCVHVLATRQKWSFQKHRLVVQGNRELIDSMAGGSAKVLTQVLKLIDNHDLYGSVAYPKRHTQKDISDIYRLCLATHGVFTNVALQEPFGLTVIEVCPNLMSHMTCG